MVSNDVSVLRAEQEIIASLLQNKTAMYERFNQLSSSLFTSVLHQQIFAAIHALLLEGIDPESIHVTAKLIQSGKLQEAGGSEYVSMLGKMPYEERHIDSFISIVRYNGLNQMLESLSKEMLVPDTQHQTAEKRWRHINNQLQHIERILFPGSYRQLSSVIDECMLSINGEQNQDLTGVLTGIDSLDEITGRLGNGQLIIVGARPAMGKTAFLLHLVNNICIKGGKPVIYVSIEMGAPMLVQRLLSQISLVPAEKIRTGKLNTSEKERILDASATLRNAPLYIVDRAGIAAEELVRTVSQLQRKHDAALVVVDYLQLITMYPTRKTGNRDAEVSAICRSLKTLAREANIPVLVSSQLSRAVETRGGDKRPILSDLRESGSIEQDADKVMFLYRGEYYGIEYDEYGNTTKGIMEVLVAKNRYGPLGNARLFFHPASASLQSIENEQVAENMDIIEKLDADVRERFMRVFNKLDGHDGADEKIPF